MYIYISILYTYINSMWAIRYHRGDEARGQDPAQAHPPGVVGAVGELRAQDLHWVSLAAATKPRRVSR